MNENEIARQIVNCCFKIHLALGPGLFEKVYECILEHELLKAGLSVERQKQIPVCWENIYMEDGYRADLIVMEKVLIEIKSVNDLASVHFKQVQTYLKLTDIKLGLLINFNEALIKNGIHRVVNKL